MIGHSQGIALRRPPEPFNKGETNVKQVFGIIGATLLVVASAGAHPTCPGPDESSQEAGVEALTTIIHDIKEGWENADGSPFREHFLDFDGGRYIESGGQNEGLDDLVEHHVEPEGETLEFLRLSYSGIEPHFEENFAWAVTDVRVEARVRSDGREIDKRGHGTWLFRCVEGQWKVVHTHSSTR